MNENDNRRRPLNGPDGDGINRYDEFQRQYEEQLREFSLLNDNIDYDDEIEFQQYDLNESGAAKRSVRPDRYENSAAQKRTAAQSSKPAKAGSKPSRKKSGRSKSSSQQHIRRDEPLRFGSHSESRKNQKDKQKYKTSRSEKQNNKGVKNKKMRKEKRRSPVKTFFVCLLVLIIVLFVLLQLLIFRYLGMVDYVESGERLVTNASMKSDDVMNVLVIGSDTRSKEERGRTDSMILMSVNKKTKEITMTSFMRDMYVEIPDNGWAKMNAAYVYGGAELLMDTIELNFDIDVDKYVYVDFYAFVDIVDAVGGIELDISDEEAAAMTSPMNEQNMYLGKPMGTDNLKSGGKSMKVNGNQALAYARTRYAGNADFERTQRQRTVISKILEKAKTLNPLELDSFARTCMSNLTTNMTKNELYFMTYRIPFMLKYDVNQLRIPEEGAYSYGNHDGQSTLDVDFDMCREALKNKIYK